MGFRALRRAHRRLLVLVVAGVTAAGIAAGVALATSSATSIGTGVVVINTNLGLSGGAAAGTGMVLTSSGEVLTNNHVIRGATSIKIVIPSAKRTYNARVVGYDVTDDVAVLQASGASHLKTVSTAPSLKLRVGMKVTALGNANGGGRLVAARGSITGLRKAIQVSDDSGGTESLSGLIETNAALQPGDSGGPLLTSNGKVIGMDTAASSGNVLRSTVADGYAIPISKALSVAKLIKAGKASTRIHVGATAFLGIQVQPAGDFSNGVVIAGIVPGGPAEAAGLAPGDVITAIDGNTLTSPTGLTSYLLTKKPGATVTVTFVDQTGLSKTANVTLASGPPQ
jgi:S1-C subfamily serine protease